MTIVSFNDKVKQCIPAEVYMIASSSDSQQSNESYNISGFELPNPAGQEGGVCTTALLKVLYQKSHSLANGEVTWVEVLMEMKRILNRQGFSDQTPMLSSSRWMDINQEPMRIVPSPADSSTTTGGRRRAMLIGINYAGVKNDGQQGELKTCHNDVDNIRNYLIAGQGFNAQEMLILKDDNGGDSEKSSSLSGAMPPTKKNILCGFMRLAQYSQPGDVIFVSFSGHGGRRRRRVKNKTTAPSSSSSPTSSVVAAADDDNDTAGDGFHYEYDSTLIPVDFKESGQIAAVEILDNFCKRLKQGVTCTVLVDCCHSGTALNLPYTFSLNGGSENHNMKIDKTFSF